MSAAPRKRGGQPGNRNSAKHGAYSNGQVSLAAKSHDRMKQRCTNPKDSAYLRYGGRGITIAERWLSLANFIEDMGERPGPEYQLDRIDNDGNYEPGNCRWVLHQENQNNRRSNRLISYEGWTLTLSQWAEKLGCRRTTLHRRISVLGWDVERAFTTPVRDGSPWRQPLNTITPYKEVH